MGTGSRQVPCYYIDKEKEPLKCQEQPLNQTAGYWWQVQWIYKRKGSVSALRIFSLPHPDPRSALLSHTLCSGGFSGLLSPLASPWAQPMGEPGRRGKEGKGAFSLSFWRALWLYEGSQNRSIRTLFFWLSLSLGWYLPVCYSQGTVFSPVVSWHPAHLSSSIKPSLNYPSLSVPAC